MRSVADAERVAAADWRPSAPLSALRARARMLGALRRFFEARGVLEVETPLLCATSTPDRHIESFRLPAGAAAGYPAAAYLQTSPEFAMKRLLAAGCGPIYQVCKAFRAGESGRLHNPEFTMLEWYRPGYDQHALMTELCDLLAALGVSSAASLRKLSYREAMRTHAGVDPFDAGDERLRESALAAGLAASTADVLPRDGLLDLLMAGCVQPRLGAGCVCVYDFPASHSALARLRDAHPPLAERFELFIDGLEVANGYHELLDADECRQRFESDLARRRSAGRDCPPLDERLLAALSAGIEPCAGVAVGLDRVLLKVTAAEDLARVLAFPAGSA